MSGGTTVGAIILTILGTLPALVILLVIVHTPTSNFRGSSLLVAVAMLFACVSLLVARFLLLPRSSGDVQTQTDDIESGNGTSGDEENNNGDAPPVYESVVAKPPPYEYLYVHDDLDPSSFPASVVAAPGNDDASAVPRQGSGGEGDRRPSTTLQEAQCYSDPDLPSYSDIVKHASPE